MKPAVDTSDHSYSTVTTVFRLYIPKAMPEAKSVWMDIIMADRSSQYVKLTQSITQPRLWFAVYTVTSGLFYHYGAKLCSWLPFKTAKISEDNPRVITKNSVHRDIFQSVEKNVVDRIDGWKFFFEETVSDIARQEIKCDIQKLLSEYFQLDHYYLRGTDQHELGRFAVECALKVGLNPSVAAFVIYYLSYIYDKPESLYYTNIPPNAALQLLNTLKGWPLQQVLGPCFSRKVTEVLFSLVRVCISKSADIWSRFVLLCYPSLSSNEILRMFQPTRYYYPSTELVSKLCSCIKEEEAEQILRAIIPFVTYLPALCEVFKAYSLSDVPDRWTSLDKYRPNIVNCVRMQLDNFYMMRHLKELSDMAAHIFSVDDASVNEILPSFEQTFLKILDRQEDARHYIPQLDKIIMNPVVFTDKNQAVKLFQIFVRSSQRSHHVLFPTFLQLQKFTILFDDDTIIQLIDQWLGRVACVMPALSSEPKSVCDLHKYVFQVSNMPDHVQRTADMRKEIKNRCMKTFCDVALPNIVRLSNVSHLEVLEELLNEMEGADIQSVEDIEAAVMLLVQKTSTCELQHAKIIENLLLQEKLFAEAHGGTKVLELVALSRSHNIHYAFLKIMTAEKFWKIIPVGECERIFNQWLSEAINYHCVNKSKKRRSGTADYYILFLYEYLADVLVMPSLKNNETVRDQIESTVKKEFLQFEPKAIIDMLDSVAAEMKEDAVKVLELHLQAAEVKNLMSERDYHSSLDRFAEHAGKDWKAKQRYLICLIFTRASIASRG